MHARMLHFLLYWVPLESFCVTVHLQLILIDFHALLQVVQVQVKAWEDGDMQDNMITSVSAQPWEL